MGGADARPASYCGTRTCAGRHRRVFSFIGQCDCFSPSDPYQSRCFSVPLIQCGVTVTATAPIGHGVWRRQYTRKTLEIADDGALVGTLALTPDDLKHELACHTLWTLKDDVPPIRTAPLSVGLRTSEDPGWICGSSVSLFQG